MAPPEIRCDENGVLILSPIIKVTPGAYILRHNSDAYPLLVTESTVTADDAIVSETHPPPIPFAVLINPEGIAAHPVAPPDPECFDDITGELLTSTLSENPYILFIPQSAEGKTSWQVYADPDLAFRLENAEPVTPLPETVAPEPPEEPVQPGFTIPEIPSVPRDLTAEDRRKIQIALQLLMVKLEKPASRKQLFLIDTSDSPLFPVTGAVKTTLREIARINDYLTKKSDFPVTIRETEYQLRFENPAGNFDDGIVFRIFRLVPCDGSGVPITAQLQLSRGRRISRKATDASVIIHGTSPENTNIAVRAIREVLIRIQESEKEESIRRADQAQ